MAKILTKAQVQAFRRRAEPPLLEHGVAGARARLLFEDSRYGPSEAYGGTRPAA